MIFLFNKMWIKTNKQKIAKTRVKKPVSEPK